MTDSESLLVDLLPLASNVEPLLDDNEFFAVFFFKSETLNSRFAGEVARLRPAKLSSRPWDILLAETSSFSECHPIYHFNCL